jgi:RND family efflux transporter MFP subunit
MTSLFRTLAAAAALGAVLQAGPAAGQVEAMLVRVDTVRQVPLTQTVPVIGRLVAQRRGEVAARINGPIKDFLVEVGDRVRAGQVLAVLHAESLQATRDLYVGRLNEAQAEHGVKKAELTLARQAFDRLERLKKSAAFNQARYDDARQAVAIAQAELRQAESAIVSARADLQNAEINLYNAEVRAPYAGVVTERLTEMGAYVSTGNPVVRMIGDQTLEIEAEVPFQHLSGLAPGIEVRIALDDGTRHTAVVRALLPSENPRTRTRAVRFVPDIGGTIRPLAHEQSVTLQIPIGRDRQVLSVHKDAVINRRGQDMVFVAVGGEAQARPVTLGEAVGNRLEVRKGLGPGERAVVRGNERLKPGDKIRVNEGAS